MTIYDSDDPGPLGKPKRAVDTVPADCGWDPTDPRAENPWTQVPVEEIQLSQEELELQAGDAAALEAVCLPEDAGVKSVTWESSAPEVASVYGGRVVGLDEGTAVITAKCGKAASSCTVTVMGELLPFSDLAAGAWYYDDMRFATAKEILNGTGRRTHGAERPCLVARRASDRLQLRRPAGGEGARFPTGTAKRSLGRRTTVFLTG